MFAVIGANGFLGSYVVRNILDHTRETVLATCRNTENVFLKDERLRWTEFDLDDERTRAELVRTLNEAGEPVRIAFLAACHHPDTVERDPQTARRLNVEIPDAMLDALHGAACIFYPSTDSVYGESAPGQHFKEDDALNPVNTYGRQKAEAERVFLKHGGRVARFPFLIGPSLLPRKPHFYDVIARHLRGGEPIELFCDSMRSSLDFNTAAALLVELMGMAAEEIPPILNLSGDDDLSKYDVGRMIARRLGADESVLVPLRTADDTGIFETARAQSTLLDNTLAKRTLGRRRITIQI